MPIPPSFAPTPEAAQVALAAVRPAAYARTRNHLDGAVTRLSPYLTHGLLTLPQVLRALAGRHALTVQHKLVFEFGWREYFRHVWSHLGDGILASLHPGPLPDAAYAQAVPQDIRRARTGVPVVDQAVRALYRDGWLHNHARMWLASYMVHLRKVHWRAGADWMVGHLLDGDLASNHLSWQWVAGTGSRKPYLFNAENVARYAPADWHSAGTVIDCGYDVLDRIARDPAPVCGATGGPGVTEPVCSKAAPPALGARAPDGADVAGQTVWLLHPWALRAPPPGWQPVGLLLDEFHAAWPWSADRWAFVGSRMRGLLPPGAPLWAGPAESAAAALRSAAAVRSVAEPHLHPLLATLAPLDPAPRLFPPVARPCASFSQWWTRCTRDVHSLEALLHQAD